MKELSEMSLEELWQLFPIILEEHNSEYKNWYKIEETGIKDIVGEELIYRINHIGSSAVEGLISKPTVDILLELNDDTDIVEVSNKLNNNGWIVMSSQDKPYRQISFNKGYTKYGFADKVYHLHMRFAGDSNELYFRDYLIECKDVADQYVELKLSLLKEYKNNRDGYTREKSDFILDKTNEARKKYGNRYGVFYK